VAYDLAERELRPLLRVWDPIGVFQDDDPEMHAPEDEYDCLIPGIYGRLLAGADEEELAVFLAHQVSDHFGLPQQPEDDWAFARELVEWWGARSRSSS
jgi:hypothetical protein